MPTVVIFFVRKGGEEDKTEKQALEKGFLLLDSSFLFRFYFSAGQKGQKLFIKNLRNKTILANFFSISQFPYE